MTGETGRWVRCCVLDLTGWNQLTGGLDFPVAGSGCGSGWARTVKHLELITHHNSISILPGRNWNNKSMKKSTTPQVDHIPQAPGSPVRNKLFNKTKIKLF